MRRAAVIAVAYALDLVAGDPVWLPHPVRAMGFAIARGERLARRFTREEPRREAVFGAALALGVTAASTGCGFALARSPAFAVALAWTTLATRDLLTEAGAVIAAGEGGDLAGSRARLARIVGRDTGHLAAPEIARAVIETLAESACDGIVAPLCALALGGVPAAFAFKAASTLDSMIGHLEPPYRDFGRFAARCDDALCYVPARLTALFICALAPVAGGSARGAWRTLRADGSKHRSPNAGRTEAAIAGALGVRLGGRNVYDGVAVEGAELGSAYGPPAFADARRAQRLVFGVSLVAAAAAIGAARAFGGRDA